MVRVYPIAPQSQFKKNSRATVPLSAYYIFFHLLQYDYLGPQLHLHPDFRQSRLVLFTSKNHSRTNVWKKQRWEPAITTRMRGGGWTSRGVTLFVVRFKNEDEKKRWQVEKRQKNTTMSLDAADETLWSGDADALKKNDTRAQLWRNCTTCLVKKYRFID